MNRWQKAELKMVTWLRENIEDFSDIHHHTDNGMSRYDCSNENTVIELKHRRADRSYDSQLLEKGKATDLLTAANMTGRKAFYVSLSGGVYYIYDLSKMYADKFQWNFEKQQHNKTSRFKNQNKVSKMVSMLPNSAAIAAFHEDGTELKSDLDTIYGLMAA